MYYDYAVVDSQEVLIIILLDITQRCLETPWFLQLLACALICLKQLSITLSKNVSMRLDKIIRLLEGAKSNTAKFSSHHKEST